MAAKPTITAIAQAIEAEFAGVIDYTQSVGEITEAIHDVPMLQVYWWATEPVSAGGNTPTMTFGGGQREIHTFRVDLFAKVRSHIGEDLTSLHNEVQAMLVKLREQDNKPAGQFGLERVRNCQWAAQATEMIYAQQTFAGARFTITVEVW